MGVVVFGIGPIDRIACGVARADHVAVYARHHTVDLDHAARVPDLPGYRVGAGVDEFVLVGNEISPARVARRAGAPLE